MPIEKEEPTFDFEEFKNKAIADMRAGKALVGFYLQIAVPLALFYLENFFLRTVNLLQRLEKT